MEGGGGSSGLGAAGHGRGGSDTMQSLASPSRSSMPTQQQQQESFARMMQQLQEALDRSSTVFHVFCSDPVGLNLAVFELWVKGFREEQVVFYRRNLLGDEMDESEGELLLLLYRDAVDQYRLFSVLEEMLVQPGLLERQLIVQIPPRIKAYMVGKYYEFDDGVLRELLGRKLTARARKDLDEVAESTGVLLPSCWRQFDNLRNIFTTMDERNFEGSIVLALVEAFRVPWELAERYTCILFLLFNRFHIQTGRKKVGALRLAEFEACAALLLVYWVSDTTSGPSNFTGSKYIAETYRLAPSTLGPALLDAFELNQPAAATAAAPGRTQSSASAPSPEAEAGRAASLAPASNARRASSAPKEHDDATAANGGDDNNTEEVEEEEEDDDPSDMVDYMADEVDDRADDAAERGGALNSSPALAPEEAQLASPRGRIGPSLLMRSRSAEEDGEALGGWMPARSISAVPLGEPTNSAPERRRASSIIKPRLPQPKPGNTSMEISPTLILRWRMIKNHVFGTRNVLDSLARLALANMELELGGPRGAIRRIRPRYKTWVKSLLTIGSGLAQAKELRDLFEDVVSMLCEPLAQAQLPMEGLGVLLRETHAGFTALPFVKSKGLVGDWSSFMHAMSMIIIRLYDSSTTL